MRLVGALQGSTGGSPPSTLCTAARALIQRDLSDAWLSKLEQAYQKAKILFGSTPEFVTIKEIYDTQIKRMKKEKMKLSIILISVFGSFLCVFGLIFLILSLNGVF